MLPHPHLVVIASVPAFSASEYRCCLRLILQPRTQSEASFHAVRILSGCFVSPSLRAFAEVLFLSFSTTLNVGEVLQCLD